MSQDFHDRIHGTTTWYGWIALHGMVVPSGCKGFCSTTVYRHTFWACYKISRMAGTSYHGPLYSSWTILRDCVGNARSTHTWSESSNLLKTFAWMLEVYAYMALFAICMPSFLLSACIGCPDVFLLCRLCSFTRRCKRFTHWMFWMVLSFWIINLILKWRSSQEMKLGRRYCKQWCYTLLKCLVHHNLWLFSKLFCVLYVLFCYAPLVWCMFLQLILHNLSPLAMDDGRACLEIFFIYI